MSYLQQSNGLDAFFKSARQHIYENSIYTFQNFVFDYRAGQMGSSNHKNMNLQIEYLARTSTNFCLLLHLLPLATCRRTSPCTTPSLSLGSRLSLVKGWLVRGRSRIRAVEQAAVSRDQRRPVLAPVGSECVTYAALLGRCRSIFWLSWRNHGGRPRRFRGRKSRLHFSTFCSRSALVWI
jgi:hypothetical protein